MDEQVHDPYEAALDTAERLLGMRLQPFFEPGPGEPAMEQTSPVWPPCTPSVMPGREKESSTSAPGR
jgi:hypothetical protein